MYLQFHNAGVNFLNLPIAQIKTDCNLIFHLGFLEVDNAKTDVELTKAFGLLNCVPPSEDL